MHPPAMFQYLVECTSPLVYIVPSPCFKYEQAKKAYDEANSVIDASQESPGTYKYGDRQQLHMTMKREVVPQGLVGCTVIHRSMDTCKR